MENEDFIEQRLIDEPPTRRSNPFMRRSSKTPKRKRSPQKSTVKKDSNLQIVHVYRDSFETEEKEKPRGNTNFSMQSS